MSVATWVCLVDEQNKVALRLHFLYQMVTKMTVCSRSFTHFFLSVPADFFKKKHI